MMAKIEQRLSRILLGSAVMFASMATLMPAIATAPMPPKVVMAKLNGQPVYVLYVTRSSDKVLVRCYPGQQPTIAVTSKADGTKEGILTCGT
jgi:hypothetical protein